MIKLHILIADDEAPARRKLQRFLQQVDAVRSISEALDGDEAIQHIKEQNPDLVLLDIQMPGKTGFEVIEAIGSGQMPPVIFVTAYDEFALQAFNVHAIDYLLKPFDRERFESAFHRALEQIKLKQSQSSLLDKLLQEVRPKTTFLERLKVTVGNRIILLLVKDILYFKADDKYVEVHTADNKYLIRETLTELESRLNPTNFARIHRSCIVQINAIRELSPRSHGDYWVTMINNIRLILSRRYRENIFR